MRVALIPNSLVEKNNILMRLLFRYNNSLYHRTRAWTDGFSARLLFEEHFYAFIPFHLTSFTASHKKINKRAESLVRATLNWHTAECERDVINDIFTHSHSSASLINTPTKSKANLLSKRKTNVLRGFANEFYASFSLVDFWLSRVANKASRN